MEAIDRADIGTVTALLGNPQYADAINQPVKNWQYRRLIRVLSRAALLPASEVSTQIVQAVLGVEKINVNLPNPACGSTALAFALAENPINMPIVNLLLEAKANPAIKNKDGVDAVGVLMRKPMASTYQDLIVRLGGRIRADEVKCEPATVTAAAAAAASSSPPPATVSANLSGPAVAAPVISGSAAADLREPLLSGYRKP